MAAGADHAGPTNTTRSTPDMAQQLNTHHPDTFDKQRLAHLCRDPVRNAQPLRIELWAVAYLAAAAVKGVDRGDAQEAAYERILKAVPQYSRRRGEAFGFFYTVGFNAALSFAEKERAQPGHRDLAVIPPARMKSTGIASAAPVTNGHGRQRVKKTEPVAILDASIRRIRAAMEKHDADDAEYRHLETGMTYLQCLRYECVGAYLPTRTPTIGYSAKRVLMTDGN